MKFHYQYDGITYRVPFGYWFWNLRKRTWKRIRHAAMIPFEWCGIFVGIAVLSSLPYRWLLEVCDIVSSVYCRFDRKGRDTAMKNLSVMFPGRSAADCERIVKRSYRNMCRSIGYAFWTFRNAKKRCARAGELTPEVSAFLSANRPAVTVSAHLGCWEILSQLALLAGHDMMSVAKDIGTAGMTRMLMRARRSIGQEIVAAEGAFKPLMAGIKSGKSLGLLVDQIVEPKDGGTPVRFFGREYYVSPAPAFFAAKAKAPIIVAWSHPLKDGRYRCEMIETVSADEARDIKGTAQRIAADLERVIRRHPSCWILNYDYFDPVWTVEQRKLYKEHKHRRLQQLSDRLTRGS